MLGDGECIGFVDIRDILSSFLKCKIAGGTVHCVAPVGMTMAACFWLLFEMNHSQCVRGYSTLEPVPRPSVVDAEKLKEAKMLAKMRLLEDQGGAFAHKSLQDLGEHGSDGESLPLLHAEQQTVDCFRPAACSSMSAAAMLHTRACRIWQARPRC